MGIGKGKHTWDLLRCIFGEMVGLALVGSTAAVPEKQPLQRLAAFQVVLEAEFFVFVFFIEEIE